MGNEKASPRLRLCVLGGAELVDATGRGLDAVLRQPKGVVLLSYVALAGRVRHVHRDELLALFWPDLDTHHARTALRTALSRLRSSLGCDPFLARGAQGLRVNDAILRCDAVEFLESSERGDAALAAYRGDLLDGVHAPGVAAELERWIDDERASLRRVATRSAWLAVDRAEAADDVKSAVGAAQRALQLSPHDEAGVRRLMALHMKAGGRASALEAYDAFARRLAHDLDAQPADETRIAMQAIRRPSPDGHGTIHGVAARRPAVHSTPRAATANRRSVVAGGAAVALVLVAVSMRGRLLSSDASAAPPAIRPAWRELPYTGSQPNDRYQTRMLLDRSGDTALIFGGRSGFNLFGDVWRLSGAVAGAVRWERLYPTRGAAPAARWLHGLAYASPTDRAIVFGGSLGFTWPCANDVWLLDGVSRGSVKWTPLLVSGEAPAPRADMTVTYDAASNSLVVFGGHDCVQTRWDDAWRLSFADGTNGRPRWTKIQPRSPEGTPGPRSAHTAAYDPISNRLIVFGGTDGRALHTDVWVLKNANGVGVAEWRPVPTFGGGPAGRAYHATGYDPVSNTLVVFGGSRASSTADSDNETWILRFANGLGGNATWRRLSFSEAQPPPRYVHATAFDALRQQLVVFGGLGAKQAAVLRDVWILHSATR